MDEEQVHKLSWDAAIGYVSSLTDFIFLALASSSKWSASRRRVFPPTAYDPCTHYSWVGWGAGRAWTSMKISALVRISISDLSIGSAAR